ncbi:MAG: acetate--CoA ligase family protein [Syntrophobacteraceae bacterium]
MILPEHEANRLLSDAGIPLIRLAIADSAEHAARCAAVMGYPVALKFSSALFVHKSDVGGVCLNLFTEADLVRAFDELSDLREKLDREAKIIIEPMVLEGAELFIGYQIHSQFGPIISVGLGGTSLELVNDVSFRLLPATKADFREMLGELKSWAKLEKGFRNLPPIAGEQVVDILEKVAEFTVSRPDLVELDLNPVTARPEGLTALDARVVLV